MMDIGWLVEHGPCKKFTAGMNVPCPGGTEPSKRAMYILLAGRVDVYKKSAAGGKQIVASLLKGDVFGGREYFTDADDCTYVAGIDSAVYVITEESFNDLSWSRPEILFDILRAAYMPLRKMTAADRTMQKASSPPASTPSGNAASAEATVAASASKAADTAAKTTTEKAAAPVAAKTAPASTTPAPMASKTASGGKEPAAKAPAAHKVDLRKKAQAAVRARAGAAAQASFFPQGHKHYLDITRPEYVKLVFPKEYVCPFCKAAFNDVRVFRSKLYESGPMRYDLRRYYTDFQTEWYDILTCHSCLFSTFHNYFTDPKPIKKTIIEEALVTARSEAVLDFDAERNIDFVFTAHYLAILCSDVYPSMGKQIRAKLWGNLSWLYEDMNDGEMEKYAAAQAAETYEQVYTESRLTPIQEQITCLSIAGMQYRAGVDHNMKKYLLTTKTLMAGDKTYAKLADDFIHMMKEDG